MKMVFEAHARLTEGQFLHGEPTINKEKVSKISDDNNLIKTYNIYLKYFSDWQIFNKNTRKSKSPPM
jgi:hypothetical protein